MKMYENKAISEYWSCRSVLANVAYAQSYQFDFSEKKKSRKA